MDGFEVDTDVLREHAQHVRHRAGQIALLGPTTRRMQSDPGAFGVALVPLGLAMSAVQTVCSGAIEVLARAVDTTGRAVTATADTYDDVEAAVESIFRAGQGVLR